MLARDIIESAITTLIDPGYDYWSSSELLGYVNEAQRQIVNAKPDANVVIESVTLVNGVRQAIPERGLWLNDMPANVDGPPITPVDGGDMNRMVPGWRQSPASSTIQHYMLDARAPTHFDVYPSADNAEVWLRYSATPEPLDNTDAAVKLADPYYVALLNYVLYRAHSKTTTAAVPQRAQMHYQQFVADLRREHNAEMPGGTPDPVNRSELR